MSWGHPDSFKQEERGEKKERVFVDRGEHPTHVCCGCGVPCTTCIAQFAALFAQLC